MINSKLINIESTTISDKETETLEKSEEESEHKIDVEEEDEVKLSAIGGLFGANPKIKFKVLGADGKEITDLFFGGDSEKKNDFDSFEDDLSSDDLDEADDDFDLIRSFEKSNVDYLTQNDLERYFLHLSSNDVQKSENEDGVLEESEEDEKALTKLQQLKKDFAEARDIYIKAQSILKKRTIGIGTPEPAYKKAYEYMQKSADLKFIPALEEMGYAYLFGRSVRQNLTQAKLIFQDLSIKGSPRAQMGLGFLHATGLTGPNALSSQSRALTYYTFASLGGDFFAQMALGYRYKYGYSVVENCESALTNYRRVAKRVAKEVRDSRAIDNPGVIQRIRLLDVTDPPQTPPPTASSQTTTSPSVTTGGTDSDPEGGSSESGESSNTRESSSSSNSGNAVLDKDLIKYYKFLADKGDMQAQLGLGQLLYQGGRGVAPDPREAYNLFYRAATESNNAFAQAFLGKMYLEGIGDETFLKADNETAFEYFSKSAKQGNPMGQTGLGVMHLFGFTINSTYDAESYNTESAINNRGLSAAQKYMEETETLNDRVAKFIRNNPNLDSPSQKDDIPTPNKQSPPEPKKPSGFSAFKKDKTPADKGGKSSNKTFIEYVKSDHDRAIVYFMEAANQGYPEAQLYLANIYFAGLGVPPNYRVALKYYNLASQSGNLLAFYNLAQMHAIGLGALRSCFTAMELFKNVAERGYWGRMLMEGYHAYKAGRFESALIIYLFLAELGYEAGQSNAAFILENENIRLFPKNESLARAFALWKKSALQGYNGARIKLGDYYYYGYGNSDGSADYEAAAHNYRTAYELQKSARALFNLAYMHECGYGLKKDLHLAKRYYDMAFQASPDAHVPVTLALAKLNFLLYFEQLQQLDYQTIIKKLYAFQKDYIPEDWDLYFIMILACLLGSLIYVRRRPPQP